MRGERQGCRYDNTDIPGGFVAAVVHHFYGDVCVGGDYGAGRWGLRHEGHSALVVGGIGECEGLKVRNGERATACRGGVLVGDVLDGRVLVVNGYVDGVGCRCGGFAARGAVDDFCRVTADFGGMVGLVGGAADGYAVFVPLVFVFG